MIPEPPAVSYHPRATQPPRPRDGWKGALCGFWLAALGVLPAATGLGSCGGGKRPVGAGILVIAVDALRADHLDCLGYDRETAPTLAELAGEGVLFTQAFAAAPWLVPAHIALVAGTDPNLGWRTLPEGLVATVERRWRLPSVVPTAAVEFLAHGWRTAAFSDHRWLAPGFGFARGFQTFEFSALDAPPRPGGSGAAGLVPRLERWVRGLGRDEPWFAYLHLHDLVRSWSYHDAQWDTYFEPRAGLDSVPPVGATEPVFFAVPPSRWLGGSDPLGVYEARYDGAIRRLDEDLRRLFDTLRLLGRYEATTICVVGAHGLQLGEAGLIADSGRLSVADLAVPWILRPGSGLEFEEGRRVEELASTTDVMPTLLELAGIEVPASMNGVSQARALTAGGEPAREFAFASCGLQLGYAAFGERLVYERCYPGLATRPSLVAAWFGDEEEHHGEIELLYDRFETPFPPLSSYRDPAELGDPSLRQVAWRWFSRMEKARVQVQRRPLHDAVKVEALEELRRLTLLEQQP